MLINVVRLIVLLPLLSFTSHPRVQTHAAAKLRLTVATLHAAALTAPRAATDSVDGPYYLVSILGPRTKTETIHLPASGHLVIHRDEALGARQLVDLSLEPGDSVQLLISVLEGKEVKSSDEAAAAVASTKALSQSIDARRATIASALSPIIANDRAHWLGSATLLLTNENGTLYWRSLECVTTCKVLSGSTDTAIPTRSGAGVAGVVELSGSGGTYHMQLQGQQTL
jgi:hypothetical protein